MKPHRIDAGLRWRTVAAAGLAVGGLMLAPSTHGALELSAATRPSDGARSAPGAPDTVRVVVEAQTDAVAAVASRVAAHGRVVSVQHSLGTLVADVPASALDDVRRTTGVANVTEDAPLQLQSGVGPTGLAGDMTNVARLTGATTFWANGYSGQGVDVALLDSGVLPIEGLTTANKLVIGPDLSFESQTPALRSLDTFGHGTHMAGIIAGRDSGTSPSTYATDTTRFVGMAPGARIVSLKLADAQGNTDVSQVIAGIDWVVAHAKDPGLNIRVLNLSFGTDSTQDYRLDPLAHAAEVAWNRGIVVVASAGNGDGTGTGLSNPAYDPALLAVGAVNTQGTADRSDDVIPAFSKKGSTLEGKRGPDLIAPGSSIVSLRGPGTFVDLAFGATGNVGTRFFKGSGTSQSAAVVSGAAALLLSQRPWLSPDQVRDVLRRSAKAVTGADTDTQGAGSLDLTGAYATGGRLVAAAKVFAGGGSLDRARGTMKVKKNGVVLTGEKDIFGKVTDTDALAASETLGLDPVQSWADGQWTAPPAQGATWAGATWAGATWAGATWAGNAWAGATWAGATWADAQWANDLWSSASWK